MEPVALGGFPFDSQITGYQPDGLPIYDRASNSEEFASLIKGFWRDGVFGTDALTVLAGSGMTATVGTGSVLVQGRVAKITSPKTVNFETANSQPRFDIVVARRDLSNAVRDIVLDVVKGVPASTPVAPSPVRNATVWELCLAVVKIPANVGMVQQQNITDTRLDKNLCGIVAATMTDVDTSRFYEQIQADLSYFREEEQAQFDSWFDSLRDILDENAVGNLYNKIENLTAEDVGALPEDGTAVDASKLGGKSPAFYSQPVNLLDNSNFANPINQRRATSYTGQTNKYTIDRWKTWGDVSVADGYISFTNNHEGTSGALYLYQFFDSGRIVPGKTYTAACMLADGSVCVGSGVASSGVKTEMYGAEKISLLIAAESDGRDWFAISNKIVGETLNIVWVAMYEGEYTAETLPPYVPKGVANERLECQRYYYASKNYTAWVAYKSTTMYAFIQLPTLMRVVPTVTASTFAFRSSGDGSQTSGATVANVYNDDFGNAVRVSFADDGKENNQVAVLITSGLEVSAEF